MGLVLQLVEARADGLTRSVEVMAISRPGDLRDVANLGLRLSEAKQLLARVQQAMVAAQACDHAVLRPECAGCGGRCPVKDWRARRVLAVPRPGGGAAPLVRLPGLGRGAGSGE